MKIGIVGLGKLGMPVALAINMKGHDIMGHDIRKEAMTTETFLHREVGPNGEPTIEVRAAPLGRSSLSSLSVPRGPGLSKGAAP
jgi:6-phosphogluconate dehydrogenase (decarboxylating)